MWERVESRVGEDFTGILVDLACRKERRTDDREGHDDRLQDNDTDEPAHDGARRVLLGFGREEFLVHGLVAEHQETGGKEEFERADRREIAEDLKVRRRQCGGNARPTSTDVGKNGKRDEKRNW